MDPVQATRSDSEEVLKGSEHLLDPLKGSHIYITGGTGFLGLWLLELFSVLNEDYGFHSKVTVVSRKAKERLTKWPHLSENSWLSIEEGDIRDLEGVPQDVNFIIHAAAISDRRQCASQPTTVAEVNGFGSSRVFESARLLDDLEKILIVSSGLVYGHLPETTLEIGEESIGCARFDQVHSVYAQSKRMAEMTAHAAISEWKLPVAIVRPFGFIGPYLPLELPWAITDFIRDSINGGPIRIMGDGSPRRSLMYGSEFAFWVLVALVKGNVREPYNIGSNQGVDLLQLAQLISEYFQPAPEILTGLGKIEPGGSLVPSVEKAQRELGVKVGVGLSESLEKTISWHRSVRSSA